ncbi:hypothetical protein MMC25_007099 [Agyrium rufum]|nr:hypothetical protein [Agyrium rufum]
MIKTVDDMDPAMEMQQKLNEFRVTAKRERRDRRRMRKVSERDRLQAIIDEKRRIRVKALKQAQYLATVYDPSGALFNIGPVVVPEDGVAVSEESFRKTEAQKSVTEDVRAGNELLSAAEAIQDVRCSLSKTQQRKREQRKRKPPKPQPVLPPDIEVSEGEENWIVASRKAIREDQQKSKDEGRAARDEKAHGLSEFEAHMESNQRQYHSRMSIAEKEEMRAVAEQINYFERAVALGSCAAMGFTISSISGVVAAESQSSAANDSRGYGGPCAGKSLMTAMSKTSGNLIDLSAPSTLPNENIFLASVSEIVKTSGYIG